MSGHLRITPPLHSYTQNKAGNSMLVSSLHEVDIGWMQQTDLFSSNVECSWLRLRPGPGVIVSWWNSCLQHRVMPQYTASLPQWPGSNADNFLICTFKWNVSLHIKKLHSKIDLNDAKDHFIISCLTLLPWSWSVVNLNSNGVNSPPPIFM